MTRFADDLTSLRDLFATDQLILDPVELITYEIDAGVDRGCPGVVLFPADTQDVVRAVAWCRDHGVPLVARGSGTGLSGGAVSIAGGLILEFSRMKEIEQIDEISLRARFQPGVIAQYFADTVAARGLHYPPDPASARSASLGGTVAENAGGPHCLKYGVTANYVMGMEIVLPDAQCLTLGGPALDYPGVDLAALLTGNEGSLAMITKTTVRLLAKPPAVMTMMAAFDSVDLACSAVSAIIADGIVPATLELMDRKMMEILEDYTHAGLPVEAGAALIIEVDGYPAGLQPQIDRITSIIARFKAFGLRCTQDEEERAAIWLARKSVAGALARLAPASLAVDPTVPRSQLGEALRRMAKICEERKVPTYYVSHAGDGNLHPQILIADPNDEKLMDHIRETGRLIMQEAVRLGGTISGEHGVGVEKRELMNFIYRPDELAAMRDIKAVFDPEERFNPGKMFPTTAPEPDLIPQRRVLPAVQAIADQIRTAAESSPPGRVAIVGNAAPDRPAPAAEICVSSRALDGVLTFVPDDMYVVAGAGTPLASLRGFLEAENRILPLVSPWEETTLGGLVAANLNGPLRARYGGIKDLLLCMEVILPDGRVIEAGRPLVKNVAGYDLPRLFVGSFGCLGMITSVTFKVLAPPKARITRSIPVADPAEAVRVGLALYRQTINASAILWIKEKGALPGKLICTFEGLPEDIQVEEDLLRQISSDNHLAAIDPVKGQDGSSIWADWVRSCCDAGPLVKYGVAPGDLLGLIGSQPDKMTTNAALIDVANGCLYLGDDDHACLAQNAVERNGYAIDIGRTPPDPNRIFKDRSGTRLLTALKQRWDPSGCFNPDGPLL
ncbi:MAG: FAD-binding oxidoreductase [Deltaproteobacteria bacterium]|nr:FAD-binding oxidoreductase [Deltaproteobacteria bacterium]